MPYAAPSLRACGCVLQRGEKCAHSVASDQARKARFDAVRPTARARGYDGKWQRERKAFLAVNGTCVRCGQPATVVNHKVAHKGDRRLFWRRSNWAAVCAPCHNGPIQSEERR